MQPPFASLWFMGFISINAFETMRIFYLKIKKFFEWCSFAKKSIVISNFVVSAVQNFWGCTFLSELLEFGKILQNRSKFLSDLTEIQKKKNIRNDEFF